MESTCGGKARLKFPRFAKLLGTSHQSSCAHDAGAARCAENVLECGCPVHSLQLQTA